MNEDLRPLYDIESSWEIIEGQAGIQVFAHKEYKDLLRIIDFGTVINGDGSPYLFVYQFINRSLVHLNVHQ